MSILSRSGEGVTVLTIDRQQRRNALDVESLNALDAAVETALGDSRALILTGAGGHFCAGADLTELEDVSFTSRLAEVLDRLSSAPITTISAISGSCMGLGMQLAISTDVRVVNDGAKFAVPVAKLGLMVDHCTLDRISRAWGEGAARHLVLTAAVLDSEDAWRLGFTQVRGTLDDALTLGARAAKLAPLTLAGSKVGFDADADRTTDSAVYEAAFARAWNSDDLREGRAAFRERRDPSFVGR